MKIALDIDGVLANFVYAFCTVAWEGFDIKTQWKRGDLGISRNQFLDVYDYMIRHDIFKNVKPYEGVVAIVNEWAKQGHEIVYITRRRPGKNKEYKEMHECQTRDWLLNNCFPTGEVIFTGDKLKHCLRRGITILVEDFRKDSLKWNKEMLVYLVDRPWNQGDYPHRITSLSEVELGT